MAPSASFKAWVRALSSALWAEVPGGKAVAQIRVQVHYRRPCITDSILDEAAPVCEVDTDQGRSAKSSLMFWMCPRTIEQSCCLSDDRSGSRVAGFRADDALSLMGGGFKSRA